MNDAEKPVPPVEANPHDFASLRIVALCLVIAAAAWFLLKELAPLLRPLLFAVFLCYVILPVHHRLKERIGGGAAILVLAVGSLVLLFVLVLLIYGSVLDFQAELPALTHRAQESVNRLQAYCREQLPWLERLADDAATAETQGAQRLKETAGVAVAAVADALTEAVVVGVYLLFLLLEAWRFPRRIRGGFDAAQADHILAVVERINGAMASYLRVKVKASLLVAVPVTIVLFAFGVNFALLWGVLTFFANFIPYLGSVVALALPILLTFLQLDFGWQPLTVAGLLIAIHSTSAYLIEPAMTGKAVDLSPLVILAALSFWGLCWGLMGMILAVPLTVMVKIVLENIPLTRPVARLLAEE